jgi:hypothetical protein
MLFAYFRWFRPANTPIHSVDEITIVGLSLALAVSCLPDTASPLARALCGGLVLLGGNFKAWFPVKTQKP